jgi:hypothetical protein
VEFKELRQPIRPKDHIEQLKPHLPPKYSPLQSNGNGLQHVYLAEVPPSMATALIRFIGDQYQVLLEGLSKELGDATSEDTQEGVIQGRTDIGPTAKEQLVRARRGQGLFRSNVRLNEKCCRVTRVSNPNFLRASHIKPWKHSSDEEKLNGCNGLLLAPHIDHLFDKGLISFTDSGALLISSHLDHGILNAWGISLDVNVGAFSDEQEHFLSYHRTSVFRP